MKMIFHNFRQNKRKFSSFSQSIIQHSKKRKRVVNDENENDMSQFLSKRTQVFKLNQSFKSMLKIENDVELFSRSLTRSRTNFSNTLQTVNNFNNQTRNNTNNNTNNNKSNAFKFSFSPAFIFKSKPLKKLSKRMKASKQTVEKNVEFQKSKKTLLSKTKAFAMKKLNIVTKRCYLIFLFNTMINEFVRHVFSNIKHTHSQYKKIKVKIAAS